MFKPIRLEGAGIVLRSVEPRDLESIRQMFNNPQTMKYLQEMTKPKGWTMADIEERHQRRHSRAKWGELIQFIVEDSKTGEFLGTSGFPTLNLKNKTAERGLILLPTSWGKGVYTAVNWLTLQYAYETLKIETVEFDTHPENTATIHFLNKIGATLETDRPKFIVINGENVPRVIFTLHISQWPVVKEKIRSMLQTKGRL